MAGSRSRGALRLPDRVWTAGRCRPVARRGSPAKQPQGYIGDVARRAPATIGAHLETALAGLASGALPYEPPSVVPIAEVADVHRAFEAGERSGKTVLRVGED